MTDPKTMLRRQILISLGLSEKESRLYELLVEQGSMGGGDIERISGLKKNTYVLLKSLQNKGLVLVTEKEGKRAYMPASPDSLIKLLNEQKMAVVRVGKSLETILPEIWQSYRDKIGKPVVQYFSGMEGLRHVFNEVYKEGKSEVWGAIGNEAPDKRFHNEIIEKYLPLRVKNKIWAHTISPDSPRARKLKRTENRDLKTKYLVDPKQYPMPAEFDTWGNYIAMMSFARGDFSAVLIEHPDLAITLQSLMKLAASAIGQDPPENGGRMLDEKI